MFQRLIKPPQKQSFFLFGPRGSGKTTWVREHLPERETMVLDLLDPVEEDLFRRDPLELERRVSALPPRIQWVVIDEVQKAPRLLDLVHRLIEKGGRRFVLTGSSPRKLKRGASNLLAGRAFVCHLHPMTRLELGPSFDLPSALRWGTLPKVFQLRSDEDRAQYLRAYALTYLKEEIAEEQLVRRLDPFRNFLEVAAQCSGQVLNYSRIAQDVGVDVKTVQSFFSILEDTLMGFRLPAWHTSVRKRQLNHPKFYLFDPGVKRAMERTLTVDLHPRTYGFGSAFEHWVLLELVRLNDYFRKDFAFSYLRTKDGAEVDLVIDRPGKKPALLEIKSTNRVVERDVAALGRFQADIPGSAALCLSLDPHRKRMGNVLCVPWQEGPGEIGLVP
jgi:predicted AAA+ superfamily ATPase